ncbi:TonB-dependent receptor plug domain-containing protein, partial [Novosphingobium sp. NRRL B-2648]
TVADALQTLTANNAGTIPASWSAFGFTTGATAPSLRGFNNAYTLTLFDGMRTAYYPLADDTQRNIVDVNSISGTVVDRIDTLLDGASATYGSDAIAGVVNVITKRQITGLHLDGSMGISQRGDGGEQRINATYGYGDLEDQGFNIYATAEYQHNDSLYLRDRSGPWSTADQSGICGTAEQGCLTNGIRNGIQADGSYNGFQSTEAFAMFNYYNVKTANSTSNAGWVGQTAAGGEQVTVSQIYLPTYVCSNGTSSITGGVLTASGCDASNGTLNPNNPYAANGQLARLIGLPDKPRETFTDAKTYRLSGGVNGTVGDGWNFSLGATASKVTLDVKNTGYIYLQGLMDAIAQGTYNFVDPSANSAEADQLVFPDQNKRATSKLAQVIATLNKDVFELPGGFVNIAVAGQYRYESINNPSSNAPNNDNPTERYYGINAVGVKGNRDIWSASYEISIPVLDQLRFKADGSYDHYSTGQKNFSPKFEAEFKPIEEIKVRGTFSKGFRAPNLNESFQLPATGYTSAQINCDSPIYTAFCAAHASNPNYYAGTYSPGITSSGNSELKPEKSTSYTFGVVLQPKRNITLTLDYWHTKIRNVITSASASEDLYTQYYTNNGVVNIPGVTVTPGVADPENPNALPLLGQIISSFKNANSMKGSGIDFSADAQFGLTNTVSLHTKATASYLIRLEQENEDGSVWRYDGSLGGCNLTSCSGAPRFRLTWQNTLDFNDKASFTLTTSYTSGYSSTSADAGGVYKDCAASAENGQLVTYDNGDPVQCHSKGILNFDGHGEVKVADKFKLYFDVLNILDTKPKYDPNAAYGLYQFNPAWSDRLFMGRYLRVGAKVDF